ncbi:ABC transporter ATP-binding protein [Legionella shakespearei]|uniref:Multidrug ABC transporter ATPase/permease n=1 Tax=Legionella shakespearei DSM 23087 TaxID=1122169 RepID=A0A0W0YV27_9GAMM|nr:ABC transporter ATP-binding protein [Legionella shakespearei]KTD60721.1 multidrug ABC transporter ATPase/permease [Legionella shakespearei DSM 23087]
MSTPSILSAIQKLSLLLTKEEKLKWFGIVAFSLCSCFLEIVTASVIVVFAQVLNQPHVGQKYLSMIGFGNDLAPGRIIFFIAISVGIIYLIKNLVAAAEVLYQTFSIQKMSYHFKNKLLHRYAEVDYGSYLTRNSSLGIQVVGGDAEQIFTNGMISIASILSESLIFFCLIGMVICLNPSLALYIFGVGAILGAIVTKGVLPKFYRFGQKLQESALYSSQNLIQFFHAFKEIVLLGKKDAFIDAYRHHSLKRSQVQAMQTSINALPRIIIEIIFVGLFVTVVALLSFNLESTDQMIGILGGYLYVGFRLMPGLNRIINQLNIFKSTIPSIERVYNEYVQAGIKVHYLNLPELDFNEDIKLENVSFSYLNTDKYALNSITLQIKKGECIGIVGETGSGKSTLVDLILGLLKPSSGNIIIDTKYPVNSLQWHKKIGYVPQTIYLTDDTIKANIAFGESDVDEPRLLAAIESAQLGRFIKQLPDGINTRVGDRGVRLSGGERQRIAIARALYREPEVLIFDEATSALDNETEARLMDTIYEVIKSRTVIMIAHRLTTLKECERIIVMEKGHISEIIQQKNNKLENKQVDYIV